MNSSLMATMLATDDVSRAFGCKLNPKLRAAIEADLRFPAYATAPAQQHPPESLPDNVVKLPSEQSEYERNAS